MNLPDPAETLEVEPSEIKQLLDSGGEEPGFRLVDCREEDEFALCRIEGGELIPLSVFAEQATARLGEARGEPIVVYCHHGMRSLQATQFLRAKGFEETFSLRGGIDLWSAEVDPSVPRY